jgi:probable rRNA maturation factor
VSDLLDIGIINEYEGDVPDGAQEVLRRVLLEAARLERVGNGEVSVVLVSDRRIRELNRQFRGIDRPTDVLSFAMVETGEGEPCIVSRGEEVPRVLGDIVISIDTARRQAEEYGHPFARELGFLAVHGFLHLLGYDHETPEEERDMFARQEEILRRAHLSRG